MRRGLLLGALLLVGAPSAAQQVAAPADPAAQVAQLQREMLAAQEEIIRLRGQLAANGDAEAQIAACREKNARLVAIGGDLIEAYAARYRKGTFLPFDIGQRKFETELQETGDRIYDNRADAGPRVAPEAPAPKNDD